MSGCREDGVEPQDLRPAQEDVFAGLGVARIEPSRLVQALIRRIVAIQDRASEAEQLALVRQVRALLGRGPSSH
jgi:hypothetical protein